MHQIEDPVAVRPYMDFGYRYYCNLEKRYSTIVFLTFKTVASDSNDRMNSETHTAGLRVHDKVLEKKSTK